MNIGMDLGSSNIVVTRKRSGVVWSEPAVIAFHKKTRRIVAVGGEAYEMEGREPKDICVTHPIQNGVISDDILTQALVRECLNEVVGQSIFKPNLFLSLPNHLTDVGRRAVVDAVSGTGVRKVKVIPQPLAVLLGCGENPALPQGQLVVDIGGGTTTISLISMNRIVTDRTLHVAGDDLDQAMIRYLRQKYHLSVGKQTMEKVKMEFCEIYQPVDEEIHTIAGQDMTRELPDQCTVTQRELAEVLEQQFKPIVAAILEVLEQTPPELVSDIADHGIWLTGGTALLKGLPRYLMRALNVNCRVAEHPLTAAAEGVAQAYTKKLYFDETDN